MDTARRTGGAPGSSSTLPAARATKNNCAVSVLRGELYATPFATSDKPFTREVVPAFGLVNSILNPPNAMRRSTYNAQYNRTTLTVQSAGTMHKRSVPYKPNAHRNRVRNDPPARDTSATQVDLTAGGDMLSSTVYPYRVISRTAQAASVVPMEARLGFTNAAITAALVRREHMKLWR